MIVLGVHDSHDSSACILVDGKVVAAAMEERFQRVKSVATFPLEAARYCLAQAGLTAADVDLLAFATEKIVPTNMHSVAGTLTVEQHLDLHERYFAPMAYEGRSLRLADVFPDYKPEGVIHYPLERVPFAASGELTRLELAEMQKVRTEFAAAALGIDPGRIALYDHHECHAHHAYYTAPERRPNVAVVTSDGGGDAIYESVTHVVNGEFETVHRGRTSLLGKIYSNMTLYLRMHPHRHPYKVMGLAPYASEHHRKGPRQVFLDALQVEGLRFKRDPAVRDFFKYFADRLRHYRFDAIAGGVQDFVEIRLEEWFRNISTQLRTRDFIFGGGVANNTKANLRLLNQPFVRSLFVPFGPSDEGLSLGAAFRGYYEKMGPAEAYRKAGNALGAGLGPAVTVADVARLRASPHVRDHFETVQGATPDAVAQIISAGHIVAVCQGRMEFGARSLGFRSLVCDPSSAEAKRRLNDLIKKRDFWMPFAPSVLPERFDDYFVKPAGIEHWDDAPADYMTLCFDTTALGRQHLAAAIHPHDFTARPQAVRKTTNPFFYDLLKAFERRSGIGAVLNTSLNIHEKPIVLSPANIIDEIVVGGSAPLDYILTDGELWKRRIASAVAAQ